MTAHASHPDIIKRLKRAGGHLASIVAMLEGNRECLEIVQQLQAVESAIANAKKILVHDHIDHCLEHAIRVSSRAGSHGAGDAIRDFKELTKYL